MALDNLNQHLTAEESYNAIERIMTRLDEVNNLYIERIGAQIKKIGELNQSSVNRLIAMADMGADIAEITHKLQLVTGLNTKDLFKVYDQVLNDTYTDPRFSIYLQENPLPRESTERLTRLAQNVSIQTAKAMRNFSNTTAISSVYREAVDLAIAAVSSGVADYKSATREAVQKLGYNGLQVQYQSGYHRRLDTTVRQNIIDGANQLAQTASLMMGETLGFDAVEISAHARSAPDHEAVQGKVFLKTDFEKMQAEQDFIDIDGKHYPSFRRPIGEWNCMHIAMSFSTTHSVRRYTDTQLMKWKADNAKGCMIGGKHYTTYKAVQLMRQIETEVRRQKDAAVAAQAANDMALRNMCQKKINALSAKYMQFAQAAGITPRWDRMTVAGFRAIKTR